MLEQNHIYHISVIFEPICQNGSRPVVHPWSLSQIRISSCGFAGECKQKWLQVTRLETLKEVDPQNYVSPTFPHFLDFRKNAKFVNITSVSLSFTMATPPTVMEVIDQETPGPP